MTQLPLLKAKGEAKPVLLSMSTSNCPASRHGWHKGRVDTSGRIVGCLNCAAVP